MAKFVKTKADLAEACGVSRQTIQNWSRKPDFPQETSRGWNVERVAQYIEGKQTEAAEKQQGPDADVKREKLLLECDILREKLASLRRENIGMSEHLAEFAEYGAMVNGVFDQWIEQVKAMTRDAELVLGAERLRDAARAALMKAVEG